MKRKREHDARRLTEIVSANTIDLVVTSPPYPMIAMWDELFRELDSSILPTEQWTQDNAMSTFEKMHKTLDVVWRELYVVMKEGGIVAINIGDATRSVAKRFHLFPNAARITMAMVEIGFTPLPNIYWKKSTNKPNAFLGSGFYPVNAYVTIDCEHILLFRKGEKRAFPRGDEARERSKFSKEERNTWFSQIWSIPGARQKIVDGRRTAVFPTEIPERLIRMFSIEGDLVLDPFVGTGTTLTVAKKLFRNSLGLDIKV